MKPKKRNKTFDEAYRGWDFHIKKARKYIKLAREHVPDVSKRGYWDKERERLIRRADKHLMTLVMAVNHRPEDVKDEEKLWRAFRATGKLLRTVWVHGIKKNRTHK